MDHRLAGFQIPAMAQPPLMNQPPQIFGAHAYDSLQMQHLSPDLTAQMFGDPSILLDDANEAKRRRIARVSSVPRLRHPPPQNPVPEPAAPAMATTRTVQHNIRHMDGWMDTQNMGPEADILAAIGLRYVQEKEDQV